MAQESGPYTNYNKLDEVPTLIGNWVEERELKDLTGITRNLGATQAIHDSATTSSPTLSRGDMLQATHPRVIEHVQAQTHPADWQTTVQATYRQPADQSRLAAVYVDTSKMGPRERMMHEQLMREAQQLPPELQATISAAPVPITTATTYGADFTGHDLTGIVVGAKVMKDRDGRPAQRDPTFLAESCLMPKHAADRIMGDTARAAGARDTAVMADPNVPVTIYTEAVAKKTYGGVFPGTTTLNGASPFGKSANFSKPMSDYSKVVVDE